MYRELLLGCGHRREKIIATPDRPKFENLTTLDKNPDCGPDVIHDLSSNWMRPLPFEDNVFDEMHAYEVLEHLAIQGDEESFFKQFGDYWRVLKPNGYFCATTPRHDSIWAWGDPGHRRIINQGTLTFLSHAQYEKQLGKTPMADYRALLGPTNFELVWSDTKGDNFCFVLKALKPTL